jgi:hypothetical protein
MNDVAVLQGPAQVPQLHIVRTFPHRLALQEWVGYLGGVTGTKIKAFSSYLKDYPAGLSLWEKESLAAEAYLADDKKARKPSKKKATLKRERHERRERSR